jgi:hypothetical protein
MLYAFLSKITKKEGANSMKFDIELHAFLEAAKRLQDKGILKELKTDQLEKLYLEIAEDPDMIKKIKKMMQ